MRESRGACACVATVRDNVPRARAYGWSLAKTRARVCPSARPYRIISTQQERRSSPSRYYNSGSGEIRDTSPKSTRTKGFNILNLSGTSVIDDPTNGASPPDAVDLEAAYPNPSDVSTAVPYTLGSTGCVMLAVFEVLGRPIEVFDRFARRDSTKRGGTQVAALPAHVS